MGFLNDIYYITCFKYRKNGTKLIFSLESEGALKHQVRFESQRKQQRCKIQPNRFYIKLITSSGFRLIKPFIESPQYINFGIPPESRVIIEITYCLCFIFFL